MSNIFLKIINNEIKSIKLYEDEWTIVIKDINPKAKIHLLVIPKIEIKDLNSVTPEILTKCLNTIQYIVKKLNINKIGYRVITNIGENGGQEVPHLHFHILGGEKLQDIH